jgi:hypothetical protein
LKRTKDVLKASLKHIKKHHIYPTLIDLMKVGISREMVRASFGSIDGLRQHLAAEYPDEVFDLTKYEEKSVKKSKVYIITTAVTEAPVHKPFLHNLKCYAEYRMGQLIILPSLATGKSQYTLDPLLADQNVVLNDLHLNTNFMILGLKNTAKAVDPTTGLPRAGRRGGSIVTASPKQRLKYIATGIQTLPNAIMTTGAVTLPHYGTKALQWEKSAYMANLDHVMGAIIVEIDGNKFHFRQIQADKHGNFVDLNHIAYQGLITETSPKALVLGDWHVGSTNQLARKASIEQIKFLKPKYIFLHDFADMLSANAHLLGKELTLGKMARKGKLSLAKELEACAKELDLLAALVPKVVIVKSNHDDFLDRYLNEGRYVKDHENHILALELAVAMAEGYSPLAYGVKKFGSKAKNVIWLEEDESFEVEGIECGAHGHRGSGGTRGSPQSMENAFLRSVSGHNHTPQILRGTYIVGTNTDTNPDYGKGPSSWFNTNCSIYKHGLRQLINAINGDWKI